MELHLKTRGTWSRITHSQWGKPHSCTAGHWTVLQPTHLWVCQDESVGFTPRFSLQGQLTSEPCCSSHLRKNTPRVSFMHFGVCLVGVKGKLCQDVAVLFRHKVREQQIWENGSLNAWLDSYWSEAVNTLEMSHSSVQTKRLSGKKKKRTLMWWCRNLR